MSFLYKTPYIAVAVVAAMLSACTTTNDECEFYGDGKIMGHSEQWSKEKKARCTQQKISAKEHTHSDGITHIHEYNGKPHYHNRTTFVYEDEGVVIEEDVDVYPKNNLRNLQEDDADIIEWNRQHAPTYRAR